LRDHRGTAIEKGTTVKSTTARSLALAAVVVVAALGACAKQGEKAAEPSAAKVQGSQDWGAGPYTEWKAIK